MKPTHVYIYICISLCSCFVLFRFILPCTPLKIQWSLDSGGWKAALAANASVTVGGLLDGVHSLSIKHDYTADGRSETESVGYT